MNNSLQPKAQKMRFSVAINTKQYQDMIATTLSDPERIKRFTASITSAVAVNPALQDCSASTILSGALLGESLNLSPSPQLGHYYLVPFAEQQKDANGNKLWVLDENGNKAKDSKGRWIPVSVKNAQFILGYRGYIQLAIRSGYYLDIEATEIHAGEYKGRDRFTGKPVFEFIEDDNAREAEPVVGYMAYFEYMNGFRKVLYWTKEKMMQHADTYSAAFSADSYQKLMNGEIPDDEKWRYSSFWYKDFDAMAKKTMLRQIISKWGVMSTEMQKAYDSDTHTIMNDGRELYPDADELPEGSEPEPLPAADQTAQPPETSESKRISLADV